jgi:hypothetical protein
MFGFVFSTVILTKSVSGLKLPFLILAPICALVAYVYFDKSGGGPLLDALVDAPCDALGELNKPPIYINNKIL